MNPNENEAIFITYMYPKCCKWKTKIKKIEVKDLEKYKKMYKILYINDYDVREEYKKG